MQNIQDNDPDDPKYPLLYVEFYITNVCNLNCPRCNRFNNYHFSGHQLWEDYQAYYEAWSRNIRLQRVTIMGGEPLLNPSIVQWIRGINRLFDKPVQVLTNGTRLNKVAGLYEAINEYRTRHGRNWIGVSIHNANDRQRCFDNIREFLQEPIEYFHRSDPRNHDNACTYGGEHAFLDKNGVRICVWEYDSFYQAAVRQNRMGNLTLHDSDPDAAHDVCGFARYKCYHFIRGKLYKCGPVALFPEFDQQHNLDISDQDRILINSYRPLAAEEFDSRGPEFFRDLDNVIPQCKFCPSQMSNITIFATSKKTGATSGYE